MAVVGMGPIGRLHAQVYRDNPGTELVAVCDLIEERARRSAAELGVAAYTSVERLLAGERRLELASVATSGADNGGDHYAPTMALLRAGVAVLGEKPISNSLDEAREMARCAADLSVPYGIDFNHRFTPSVQRAKQWIDAGRIGELAMVRLRMWIANPNESSPWFHLRSLHPHSFDLLRFYGGELSEVAAFANRGAGRKIWSNVEVIVRFRSGAIGSLAGSYDAGPDWPRDLADITGSKGRVLVENGYDSLSYAPRDGPQVETQHHLGGMRSFPETFTARIGRFIEQVSAGVDHTEIEGSGYDAVAAQTAIEAAITSATEGRFVTVATAEEPPGDLWRGLESRYGG
ncbi:MAG: Gfo/Idh/MocA family oxidoreductase [Actinomycetota bacterium]|nr:Gfo/Idh/MocA family oxidoreductase [Actinomycetota bacterium]